MALAPGAPQQQPQQPTALSPDASALLGQMKSEDARTQDLLRQEGAELKAPTDRLTALMAQPGPQSPQPQKVSEPPDLQKAFAKDANEFLTTAAVVAAFGGAISRQHMTAALTSFGSAVKGLKQGQTDVFNRGYEQWKASTEATIRNNDQKQKEYEDALADRKRGIDEQMAQINMIATKYHDPLMAQAASAKNYLMVGQLMERMREANDKLDLSKNNLDERKREFDQKMQQTAMLHGLKVGDDGKLTFDPDSPIAKAKTQLTAEAKTAVAYRYIVTGQIAAGFDKNLRADVMNEAAEILKKVGLTPEQFATLPQQKKADAQALARDVSWMDGIERQQELMRGMIPIVEGWMKQLPLTEIQRVNGLIISGAQEFGNPAAQAYGNAMTTLAMEYGRLTAGPQSAAMLPVEVVKLGMNRFQHLTPDQFGAEKVLIQQEADNSVKAQTKIIERRRNSLQTIAPPDTASSGAGGASSDPLGIR